MKLLKIWNSDKKLETKLKNISASRIYENGFACFFLCNRMQDDDVIKQVSHSYNLISGFAVINDTSFS